MTISVRLPSENSCEGGNQTKKVSSHQNRADAASCFQLLTSAEKNFKNAWTNSLNLLLVFFFSRNFLDKKFTQLFSLKFRVVVKYELNCFPGLYFISLNDYGSSEKWNSVIQREN